MRVVQNDTNTFIKDGKVIYYTKLGNKLLDPKIGHKHFWSAYKKLAIKKEIQIYLKLLKMKCMSLIVSK